MRENRSRYMDGSMGQYMQDAGPYGNHSNEGSGRAYRSIKDIARNYLVDEPRKGWSGLFGLAAGIGTLLTGGLILPALFTGLVAGGVTRLIGDGYHYGRKAAENVLTWTQNYKPLNYRQAQRALAA